MYYVMHYAPTPDVINQPLHLASIIQTADLRLTVPTSGFKSHIDFSYSVTISQCTMAPLLFFTWTLIMSTTLVESSSRPEYELIHSIQDTKTGSVVFQCREETTTSLKLLNVTNVIFRENSTDTDLRERGDVTVIETDDQLGIVFNLTRNLEGYYICGRRIDSNSVYESRPKPLICKL